MSFESPQEQPFENVGKIKMKSTDESGIERTLRGNITEVSQPLLSAAEVSKRWNSLLCEDGGILLERSSPVSNVHQQE